MGHIRVLHVLANSHPDTNGYAIRSHMIVKHQNPSLKRELENSTEEIRLKSLKKESIEKGIKENNDILDDDLTIIGIGK